MYAQVEDEPHTFIGLSLSAVGVSIVHVGHEELLYVSGQQLTVDHILSQRTATMELVLHALQVIAWAACASCASCA